MAEPIKLDAQAWLEPRNDMIHVKVRCLIKNEGGQPYKRGIIFTIPESMLCDVAECMEYPQRKLNAIDVEPELEETEERFTQVADEVNE